MLRYACGQSDVVVSIEHINKGGVLNLADVGCFVRACCTLFHVPIKHQWQLSDLQDFREHFYFGREERGPIFW